MSDVQSAAERLRRCEAGEDPVKVYDPQRPAMRLGTWGGFEIREAAKAAIENDYETLADAWLAENDPTPIDEEWLWKMAGEGKAVSTAIGMAYRFRIDDHCSLVVWARACGVGFTSTMRRIKRHEDGARTTVFCDLVDLNTRGDLYRLASALGIPLTP